MVTAEELRERPVLLELRLGGCEDKLQWLVRDELNYSKLEKMSAKDAVEYMLHEHSIAYINPAAIALVSEMENFIEQAYKSWYEISTVDGRYLTAKIVTNAGKVVKVIEDQRIIPVKDILISSPATMENKEIDIWYQEMTLRSPTWVCG
jgi:hypothetical protein